LPECPNPPDGSHIAAGPTGSRWAAADRPVPSILEIATDGTITRHRLPYRRYPSTPVDISTGNDGSLWFTLNVSDQVGTMLPDGTFQLRNLPFGSHPIGVTQTDDNSVWVSMAYPGAIGRIAPDGTLSSFAVPTPYAYPYYLTEDAVGNVWFVEQHRRRGLGDWDWLSGSSIGRITPEGEITEIPVSEQNVALTDIASSPGGGIWYTGAGARYVGTRNLVGQIAPDGEISRFPLGVHQVPAGITPGPDGAMWFAINGNGAIGRITRQGTITTFPLPDGVHPWDIVSGADGALWFTVERRDAMIGRITVQGRVHLYDVPTSWSQPQGILRAGDGSLWFTEAGATSLGHVASTG
jgi:virginiamycin B lyase